MKSYLFREIAENSEDGSMTVSRHRSTRGGAAIIIKVKERPADPDEKSIVFQSISQTESEIMTGETPEDYEDRAIELADMILKVAKDTCDLPRDSIPGEHD